MKTWYVYIVRCRDNSLFTGVTADLAQTLADHNAGTGARYTKLRRPVHLAWQAAMRSKAAAERRRAEIRRSSGPVRERLVLGNPDPAAYRAMMLGEPWTTPDVPGSEQDRL